MRNESNPPAWPKPTDSLHPPRTPSLGGWTELVDIPGEAKACHPPSTLNSQPSTCCQPVGKWIERFEEWLAYSGFLKKQ